MHVETTKHPIPENFNTAHITPELYEKMYQESISDPDTFWAKMAEEQLSWDNTWQTVSNCNFEEAQVKWFEGAKLNVSVNCIDRHLETRADQTAIIFEPNDPSEKAQHITYQQLHDEVCKLANAMKELGVKKGSRVCIYMPMIPQAAYAMLACARIGAIHSVVFAGFSAEALRNRIEDANCRLVITADTAMRGDKKIMLKQTVDDALEGKNGTVHNVDVLVVKNSGDKVEWHDTRDIWYHEAVTNQRPTCEPESMEATDPLFILYTSGSTGRPKGVVHSSGGYLLYASLTHKYTFDHMEGDIYWCTADVGWITGHSYVLYGPLCNGGTTLMFEGTPTWPDASRWWQIIDKHKVNTFYTAPTAIRALEAQGNNFVSKCSLSSLRLLGTVGEPINPEVWHWYHEQVGHEKCPIVDTWWQTETGGHILTPLPGATELKAGSATKPFFGIQPVIVNERGQELEGPAEGILCFKGSWPGQMITVYGDHDRFLETYFITFKGLYFSGDGCYRDMDGDYWITGRVDDVLNVSGHRLGTAEIESAIVEHEGVSEAAVVGYPHAIKGEGVYAYITLSDGQEPSDKLEGEIKSLVRNEIGAVASLDIVQWAPNLPKTRSGKIMRRILRKIAAYEEDSLGDISTLADPSAVKELIAGRQ